MDDVTEPAHFTAVCKRVSHLLNGPRRDRVKKATVGKEAWKSVTMEVIQRGDGGVGGDGRVRDRMAVTVVVS